jgi:hypothetical protein
MNEKEMIWWMENVWCRRANLGSNPRSLLVLDSFTAHRTDPVKCHFKEKNTDMAVIPGGLTSRLQPLDVSLNKAFKAKVVRYYEFKIISKNIKKILYFIFYRFAMLITSGWTRL